MQGGNLGTRRSCAIANAFPDGWGKIPDNPLIAASIAALFKGGSGARSLMGGWSPDDEGRLTYGHIGKRGGRILVSLDQDAVLAGEGKTDLDSQWSFVERVSPLTVDVLLAVLAQICAPGVDNGSNRPLAAPVPIAARAILGYKGLQRWGAEGAALRRRVDEEIVRLHGLRFDIRGLPGWDPDQRRWNARGVSVDGDRLFDIVDSTIARSTRKGDPVRSETVWLARAGQWAHGWMNSQAGVRLGAVPQQVLEFDHRRNRGSAVLAKKIGLDTVVLWDTMPSRNSRGRRIGDLLEDIGELPRLDVRSGRWGARMRDRFDWAILTLQETGVLGVVVWPMGYEAHGADRGKGWVETWLASTIVLNRPGAFGAYYIESARDLPRQRRARKTGSGLSELRRGLAIRAMRIERDVSQARLARELGISAAYLSQIENEKRMVSRAMLARIAGWVRRNGEAENGGERRPGAVVTIETGNKRWQSTADKKLQAAGRQYPRIPATGTSIGKDERT